MNEDHQADYSLQDYISQNLLHELNHQAKEEQRDNNTVQAFVMSSMGVALEAAQREEVREVMRAYYYAFNNQILGQVRDLWQQDVDVECILPGHAKAVSLNRYILYSYIINSLCNLPVNLHQ